MMAKVSTTRKALLERKERIELAEQGREILEQKRSALMKELLEVVDQVMEEAGQLEQAAQRARRALAKANAVAGREAVISAGLASHGQVNLEILSTNLMGVRVPEIEQRQVGRSMLDRGYAITGTSTTIDEAASAFEDEVQAIIALAESELRLRRLAEELRSTSRRANALEQVLIPRLEAEQDYIELALQERERDEHFRLKLVKRRRAS